MRPMNRHHEVVELDTPAGTRYVIQMGDGGFYAGETTYTVASTENVTDATHFRRATDAVTRIAMMTRRFDATGGRRDTDPD